MTFNKTLAELAQQAIDIQDASNLRGVLLAWHKALCQDTLVRGGHEESLLNLLYMGKVSSLTAIAADPIGDAKDRHGVTWGNAYEWAKKLNGAKS